MKPGPGDIKTGSAERLDRGVSPGPDHGFTVSKSGRDSLRGIAPPVMASTPLRYSFSGVLASDNRFITTSLAGVGVGMVEQGALTPIPFDTAIAVPYSAATQATDYKVRLYPTRLPGQVVRTGPYTGTIMVTVSVP